MLNRTTQHPGEVMAAQLVILSFIRPKGTLTCSKQTTSEPYPTLDESSPHPHRLLLPSLLL
jgi:hypothetical protein